ncbi:MAG: glycosyltransferase [Planctomycetaceae bacterium]|nr:glycosyltransferase [Planctomycetaceae bacterium]
MHFGRKPHICQLVHSLDVGGAELLAARIARQLRPEFDFSFLCLDREGTLADELRADGFPVQLLGREAGVDWQVPRRLRRLVRQNQIDMIHAHQYTPFFYALSCRLTGAGRPVLFTEHGRWFPDFPSRKRMLFNRLLLRKKDRVTAVGEAVRQALIRNEGLSPRRVQVVYNGIDLLPYRAAGESSVCRESVRAELGIGADQFVILQVARLDHLKDHLTAVHTMARVVDRNPAAVLCLVGDGEERPRIEAEIARLQLGNHVRLLGLRRDVPQLLAGADLFLLTSISEGIPLTLIEAMAAGVPIVSTDVGGVSELVQHGQTALLAPAGDAEQLAGCVLQLMADQELRKTMMDRAAEVAERQFSEDQMLSEYERLYREMLPACRSARVLQPAGCPAE